MDISTTEDKPFMLLNDPEQIIIDKPPTPEKPLVLPPKLPKRHTIEMLPSGAYATSDKPPLTNVRQILGQ